MGEQTANLSIYRGSVGRKRGERFPGFKRRPFKPLDSYFSSGKPTKREQKEWRDWHGDYKEKDYFKQYLREVKTITFGFDLFQH
jgi:hypothetical protein